MYCWETTQSTAHAPQPSCPFPRSLVSPPSQSLVLEACYSWLNEHSRKLRISNLFHNPLGSPVEWWIPRVFLLLKYCVVFQFAQFYLVFYSQVDYFIFCCCSAFDRQVQIGVLQNHCTLTCPPTHLMPGYRIARSDQKRVGQKYMCNFCSLLLRDAMQTGCGHFYCSSCLGSLSLWVKLVLNDILLLVLLGNHLLTYKLWSCLLSMQC